MPPTVEHTQGPVSEGPAQFDPAGPDTAPVAREVDRLAVPLAAAVLACPAVARLSAGPFGTVGTYLPGRRVTGIQVTETTVTVRVVMRAVPLPTLETQVRAAVTALVPGLPVDIGVDDLEPGDDLDTGGDPDPATAPGPGGPVGPDAGPGGGP